MNLPPFVSNAPTTPTTGILNIYEGTSPNAMVDSARGFKPNKSWLTRNTVLQPKSVRHNLLDFRIAPQRKIDIFPNSTKIPSNVRHPLAYLIPLLKTYFRLMKPFLSKMNPLNRFGSSLQEAAFYEKLSTVHEQFLNGLRAFSSDMRRQNDLRVKIISDQLGPEIAAQVETINNNLRGARMNVDVDDEEEFYNAKESVSTTEVSPSDTFKSSDFHDTKEVVSSPTDTAKSTDFHDAKESPVPSPSSEETKPMDAAVNDANDLSNADINNTSVNTEELLRKGRRVSADIESIINSFFTASETYPYDVVNDAQEAQARERQTKETIQTNLRNTKEAMKQTGIDATPVVQTPSAGPSMDTQQPSMGATQMSPESGSDAIYRYLRDLSNAIREETNGVDIATKVSPVIPTMSSSGFKVDLDVPPSTPRGKPSVGSSGFKVDLDVPPTTPRGKPSLGSRGFKVDLDVPPKTVKNKSAATATDSSRWISMIEDLKEEAYKKGMLDQFLQLESEFQQKLEAATEELNQKFTSFSQENTLAQQLWFERQVEKMVQEFEKKVRYLVPLEDKGSSPIDFSPTLDIIDTTVINPGTDQNENLTQLNADIERAQGEETSTGSPEGDSTISEVTVSILTQKTLGVSSNDGVKEAETIADMAGNIYNLRQKARTEPGHFKGMASKQKRGKGRKKKAKPDYMNIDEE